MNLKKINIILVIVAAVLLLIFIAPEFKRINAGRAYTAVQKLEPSCFYQKDEKVEIHPDICCMELQKQLECIKREKEISCSIIWDYEYLINKDQYQYCRQLGYRIPDIIGK